MAALLILTGPARGDIIPQDMTPIYVSTILTNMDTFPEYVFVQLKTMGDEIRQKQVIGPKGSFMIIILISFAFLRNRVPEPPDRHNFSGIAMPPGAWKQ